MKTSALVGIILHTGIKFAFMYQVRSAVLAVHAPSVNHISTFKPLKHGCARVAHCVPAR